MTQATFAALPSNVDDRAQYLVAGLDHVRRCLGLDLALAHGDHLPGEFAVFNVQAAAGYGGAVGAGLHALHAGGEDGTDRHWNPLLNGWSYSAGGVPPNAPLQNNKGQPLLAGPCSVFSESYAGAPLGSVGIELADGFSPSRPLVELWPLHGHLARLPGATPWRRYSSSPACERSDFDEIPRMDKTLPLLRPQTYESWSAWFRKRKASVSQ
jgi:hypothetical protein